MTLRVRVLIPLSLLTCLGAAWAGVPSRITKRGWAPLVRLAGDGDPRLAIERLRSFVETLGVVLNGLDIDEPTQEFLEEVRDSLGSFDLEEFHETLPDRSGDWHMLRVIGERQGERFAVRQAPKGLRCEIDPARPLGRDPGDLAIALRSKPVDGNYLVRGEVGLGVGPVGWDAIAGTLAESARLVASGDPRAPGGVPARSRRPGTETRLKLLKSHPALRPEDIEVLGVLWESFPALGDVIHTFARVEDLLVYDVKGDGSFQQIRISARLRPDLMEEELPELSEFLSDLGPLATIRMAFMDPKGRQLGRLSFETKDLRLRLTCFVRDGELLAVEGGQVVLDDDGPAPGLRKARCLVDFKSTLNGISIQVHSMQVDWTYAQVGRGAQVVARVTKTPTVTVSGRAFGFIPTWAIDAVIPGDIDELTREFLETGCEGNEGRGIELVLRSRQAAARGPGTISAALGVEVLDSTLISLAMRIASQKLLPDPDVRGEIHDLLLKMHTAFAKDLERFHRLQPRK